MNHPPSSRPDPRSQLRALVARVDRDLAGAGPRSELAHSWGLLVHELALGPEPAVRTCPMCQHVGLREATRCGYCWVELSVLPPLPAPAAGP